VREGDTKAMRKWIVVFRSLRGRENQQKEKERAGNGAKPEMKSPRRTDVH